MKTKKQNPARPPYWWQDSKKYHLCVYPRFAEGTTRLESWIVGVYERAFHRGDIAAVPNEGPDARDFARRITFRAEILDEYVGDVPIEDLRTQPPKPRPEAPYDAEQQLLRARVGDLRGLARGRFDEPLPSALAACLELMDWAAEDDAQPELVQAAFDAFFRLPEAQRLRVTSGWPTEEDWGPRREAVKLIVDNAEVARGLEVLAGADHTTRLDRVSASTDLALARTTNPVHLFVREGTPKADAIRHVAAVLALLTTQWEEWVPHPDHSFDVEFDAAGKATMTTTPDPVPTRKAGAH